MKKNQNKFCSVKKVLHIASLCHKWANIVLWLFFDKITMDCAPNVNIFRELQVVHDTGYFSSQVSPEEDWQQVINYLFVGLSVCLSVFLFVCCLFVCLFYQWFRPFKHRAYPLWSTLPLELELNKIIWEGLLLVFFNMLKTG